jgi:hypothetical protein
MIPFTWRNCWADVHTAFHGRTVTSYVDDLVEPAIAALDTRIAELGQSGEAWAPFAKADTQTLRSETMKAFALAIQSLWERQLRSYLEGCANELQLAEAVLKEVRANQWERVERAFHSVRGLALSAFPSYPLLAALHLLGNVCRHGNGPSVARLHTLRSDLWGNLDVVTINGTTLSRPPSAELLDVELHHLRSFAAAIGEFWEDAHTIYLQSLGSKHENVDAELARRRAAGAWQPMRHAAE